MFKKFFFLVLVFMVGGLSGLFAPWFVALRWPNAPFLPPRDQTVIVNKTEQVMLGEKEVFLRAYRKNVPALASIKSFKNGALLTDGFGFLVGADGRVLTRREAVAQSATSITVNIQSKDVPARVVKSSESQGLILLQADASNLPVVSFAEDAEERMGTSVFLMSMKKGVGGLIPFVNAGIIKSAEGALLDTTIKEEFRAATGAPLVLLDGNVAGISSVNSAGYVFAVSADAIKQFLRE